MVRVASTNASGGEPFRSFEAMLNIIDRGAAFMVIQDKKSYDVNNYGEIVGFRNRFSKERWDVFLPGVYETLPKGEPLRIRRALGVVLIKGGNHKIAVQLYRRNATTDYRQINNDVQSFISSYVKTHDGQTLNRVKYMQLDDRWKPDKEGELLPARGGKKVNKANKAPFGGKRKQKVQEMFQAAVQQGTEPGATMYTAVGISFVAMICGMAMIAVAFTMRHFRCSAMTRGKEPLLID